MFVDKKLEETLLFKLREKVVLEEVKRLFGLRMVQTRDSQKLGQDGDCALREGGMATGHAGSSAPRVGGRMSTQAHFTITVLSLHAAEEQFILSQVALLEQVDALVPMLDSAHIKGTVCHCSPTTPLGTRAHRQDAPRPLVPRVASCLSLAVGGG